MSQLISYSTGGGGSSKIVIYTDVNVSPYIVLIADQYLSVDSSLPITIQLPDSSSAGRVYTVKDRTGNCSVNNITITTVSGIITIDGAASFVMNTNYESVDLIFNGTNYEIY